MLALMQSVGCGQRKIVLPPVADEFGRYRFRYEADALKSVGVVQVFDDCERTFINLERAGAKPPRIVGGQKTHKTMQGGGMLTVEEIFSEFTMTAQGKSVQVFNRNGPCVTEGFRRD